MCADPASQSVSVTRNISRFIETVNVSLMYLAVENFNFKNPRWRAAAVLKIGKSRYLMLMQNGSLQRIGRPPSWIFEIEIFNSRALQRHVLNHRACCRRYRKISQERFFLGKCNNSLMIALNMAYVSDE